MAHPGVVGSKNVLRQSASVALAALLVINASSTLAGAGSPAAPALGGLSVRSDPPAAAVYLDGQFAGRTPVSLDRLSAGDHRVRLVKEGYLKNSRVISINAGRPTEVQVALIRQVPSAMAAAGQVVRPPTRPGPTTRAGAGSPPAAPALGGLSVRSDPPAAAVYLDGQFAGQTPLSLDRLSAGEHRVRLVKEGYLENSRVISINAGRPTEVQVALTRQVPPAMAAAGQVVRPPTRPGPTTQDGSRGGGFSRKALLLGTAAGVGGAGAAWKLLFNNKRPMPGAIFVSLTGAGMAGMTSYTFTAQGANDENGDSLTYAWDFGDGASGSGLTTSHIYASPGNYTVSVTVSDGKTSASPPGVPILVAASLATPAWTGGTEPGFSSTFSVGPTIAPNQNTFAGTVTINLPTGTVTPNINTGTVTPLTYPATVTFTTAPYGDGFGGIATLSFTGVTNASGTILTGTVTATNTVLSTQVSTTTLSR